MKKLERLASVAGWMHVLFLILGGILLLVGILTGESHIANVNNLWILALVFKVQQISIRQSL